MHRHGPGLRAHVSAENPDSRLFSSFSTSKRGAFEPSITQTFYSPPLRSCVAWVLHTTKLPAIAKAFTALDSGEPHVSGRWRSLALPVRRARRAVPFADVAEEECRSDSMVTRPRAQVPGGVPVTGRAQTATSENVIRTPRRGARHPATIRTTLWRHETPHRHHGTGAPQAASSIAFHVLLESLFEDGWGQRYSPLPLPNRFHCLGRTRTPFCRVSQANQKRQRCR